MELKSRSLEELQTTLASIQEEQVTMEELSVSLPKDIADKKEKLRKKRTAFLNAESRYEEAVEYLDRVTSRKEQLGEIAEKLETEIVKRKNTSS